MILLVCRFLIQIKGQRTKGVVHSTDCKAPCRKLRFVILSSRNKTQQSTARSKSKKLKVKREKQEQQLSETGPEPEHVHLCGLMCESAHGRTPVSGY